ncbi:MAG: S9 family peptidase [Gammaproteobacteria bacterium]|nr:S9 family peptidase [Gammaproteobacteria bacterium]
MRAATILATFLATLLLLVAPFPSQAGSLPLSDWIRWPQFRSVAISPDGKYLAVVTSLKDNHQRYQLVILPTDSVVNKHPKVTAQYSLTDRKLFSGVFWANDERVVTATATNVGGFERPFLTGKLFAVNVDGGQQKMLMGYGKNAAFLGVLSRLRKNPRAILVYGTRSHRATKPIAFWLDVYTGDMHRVAQSPMGNGGLMADHNGDVRIAWGYNSKTGWPGLYYRDADSMDWQDKTSLIGKADAAAALATGGPIMFGPDNESVYFRTWADNAARTMGLYSYDLNTGKKRLLYDNPAVDLGGVIESFDRKSLVGVEVYPGEPEILALKPKSARIQLLAALKQALPNSQVNITSWTRDGSEAIVYTWGDKVSPAYYLYSSRPKPRLTFLFHEVPWIKNRNLSRMKPIQFKTRDGLTVHGYLTIPHGVEKPENMPMVVYVHGGPHGIRVHWGYSPGGFDSTATEILADNGYAVLSLNYRGSGGYGFKFLSAGFRHWGDTMQNDLADGVKWAIEQGYADPEQVCIFGASYGGYAALMNSERFPDLYQCAVGYSGCYDLVLHETRTSDTARFAAGRLYLATVLGTNEKQLKAFSPAYNADKLEIPVLLLHGGRDERCPVDGYDHMVDAIEENGTPLKTLFYNNEGHGFYEPEHRIEAWKEMLAFFAKYIGPGATASTAGD